MDIDLSFEILAVTLDVRDEIIRRMSERHRHYHTVEHVTDMLALYTGDDPNIVAAAWFHDIVYNPQATDNEERSVEVMRQLLAKNPVVDLDVVEQIILDTKTHQPLTDDSRLFSDLDMSILGATPEVYRKYCANIMREFSHMGMRSFAEGRHAFLGKLEETTIFLTDDFRHLEDVAKNNIRKERDNLAHRFIP